MKTYCVKQRNVTECVSGTEIYVKTKNGRNMMKCQCSEWGITKTKFVSNKSGSNGSSGSGIFSDVIKYSQKGGETLFPSTKPVLKDYWSGDIPKRAFAGKTGITSKNFWNLDSGKTVCRSLESISLEVVKISFEIKRQKKSKELNLIGNINENILC